MNLRNSNIIDKHPKCQNKAKWIQFNKTNRLLHELEQDELVSPKNPNYTPLKNENWGLGFKTPDSPKNKKNRGRPKGSKNVQKRNKINSLLDTKLKKQLKVIGLCMLNNKSFYLDNPDKNTTEMSSFDTKLENFINEHIEMSKKPRAILERFVTFLEDNGLFLQNKQIKYMFNRICSNIDDAIELNNCYKNMFKRVKRIRDDRKLSMIKKIKKYFPNYNKIFRSKSQVNQQVDMVEFLFDKMIFRKQSENMAIFKNTVFDLDGGKVVCAYVDGKHSKCPTGWQQAFDLIFEIEKGNKRKSITFATTLLKNMKQTTYEEMFVFLKNCHCPVFPHIISDFETAIFNAIKEVWPKASSRGCFYHYSHNVLKRRQLINRGRHEKSTQGCFNLITVLPFVNYPCHFILLFLQQKGLNSEKSTRNGDFRLLIYIYETYVQKLSGIFKQNLQELLIRTNNVAEGKNSATANMFSKRPTMEEYVSQISYRFLNEQIAPWRTIQNICFFDSLLLEIQACAVDDAQRVINYCDNLNIAITQENSYKCYEEFINTKQVCISPVTVEMENFAKLELSKLSRKFRKYRNMCKSDFVLINQIYQNEDSWRKLMNYARNNVNENQESRIQMMSENDSIDSLFDSGENSFIVDDDLNSNFDDTKSLRSFKALRVPAPFKTKLSTFKRKKRTQPKKQSRSIGMSTRVSSVKIKKE